MHNKINTWNNLSNQGYITDACFFGVNKQSNNAIWRNYLSHYNENFWLTGDILQYICQPQVLSH